MKIKRFIEVSFQKEGVHKYPAAKTDPKLATGDWDDVSFLGEPHRHIFYFYVRISVDHDDRDIEFIQFKRLLERQFADSGALDLDYKSCEMIATELAMFIDNKYPGREMVIKVFEDDENGAVMEFTP